MDEAVPVIYGGRPPNLSGTPDPDRPSSRPRAGGAGRASAWARLLALAVALGCLAVLVRAATLPPSPTGVGTHTAMGLLPCNFQVRTGLPCPSCGMTTSFAHFARGNLAASFYTQPMGMVVALAAACSVWAGLYVAATGRPVYRLLRLLPGRYYFIPLMTFAILAWGWKILIQLNKWDGWR